VAGKRRRRPGKHGGRPAVVAPNRVQRQFDVAEPNRVWITDITYIRTFEGWLYLAIVLDLFSRQVVGWSMAVWRRQPKDEVVVHSDQGSQFTMNRPEF